MTRDRTEPQAGETVEALLTYTVDTGETPVAVVGPPGQGPDRRTGTVYEERAVTIHDARPQAGRLDIDREGVALRTHRSAVRDFYDDAEVRGVYYPEVERIVAEATGAAKIVVFDHTIRVDDEETQRARGVRAPVRNMHNDFTAASAARRVRDLLPEEEAEARLGKRFGSINVWRSIAGPVETAPLVVCDARSIDDDTDWVDSVRDYGDRVGVVRNLRFNPAHRWYYFPGLDEDEVVLLKNYDSQAGGTARFTAHGSFRHPDTLPGARPRESIEIRTLTFWD